MDFETERVEFKLTGTDEIYKEVIAFANTDGGTIYIGIDDKGNVIGVNQINETYTRLANGIRDEIQPDVTIFIKYAVLENRVIRIAVGEGASKPYYLRKKGLKPSGVFVRQGTSSVQASQDQIRRLIKETDGDNFEAMRSLDQDLTFHEAKKTFEKYGVAFDRTKYAALGIQNVDDSLFTNLAWLLSDQCQHTTKVAVFGDDGKTIFKDNKEFGGSIFNQMEKTFQYLALNNRTISTFQGLERIEKQDYPEEAIREALLNALIHRDYSFSGSIIININDSEIEFISIGGLLQGLSTEDIKSGISQPRNHRLAEVFHRLRLIESYGTGIRKIWSLYSGYVMQPKIEVTPNTFKIILPNRNTNPEKAPEPKAEKEPRKSAAQLQNVINYLERNGEATETEIQELLNVKRTRSYLLMRHLQEAGLVTVQGRGARKRYSICMPQ